MLITYFTLTFILCIKLLAINASQSKEEIRYGNSLEELAALLEAQKGIDRPIEIETRANPCNQINQLAGNLTEENMDIKHVKNPTEKLTLRNVKNVLIELRDYLYSEENLCLRNINKMEDSNITPSVLKYKASLLLNTIFPISLPNSVTTGMDAGKHSNRWKSFFDKCHHKEFLPIREKVRTSWDRRVFSEQTEILILLTAKDKSVHLKERWYTKPSYSKEILLCVLKKHTTFDDNFLTFVGILYDLMVDFYERWRIILSSKNRKQRT